MLKRFTLCIALLCCVTFLYGETQQGHLDDAALRPAGIAVSARLQPPIQRGIEFSFDIADNYELPSDDALVLALDAAASMPIPDGPNIQVSLSTGQVLGNDYQLGQKRIELGAVTLNDVPANKTFVITNTGDVPLRFPDVPTIWLSGPNANEFAVITGGGPGKLSPGASLAFDLRFMPRESGLRTATVHISSNDPGRALFSFEVAGVGNQVPKAEAGESITARKLDMVTLSALASSDPDGDSVSLSYQWFYTSGPMESAPVFTPNASSETVTFVPTLTGTYVFEVVVSDGMSSATDQVTVTVTSRTRLVTGNVLASSSEWTRVALPYAYESMVVVCTLQYDYDPNSQPMAARVTDAYGDSFKVRLFAAGRKMAPAQNILVHYVVVEEGAYTQVDDGIKMEARTYISSDVAGKGAMRPGIGQTYASSYAKPVVVGQIMSTNDANYQVFWAHGETPSAPPSSSAFHVGRHIGEDSNTMRLSETVGYVVLESGLNTCDGTTFFAGRTGQSAAGAAGGSHREEVRALTPAAAVLSNAGMTSGDGGYPVLSGKHAVGDNHLNIAIEEDVLLDPDRTHPVEGVAYVAFDSTHSALPIALDLEIETQSDAGVPVSLNGKNLSGNETWSIIEQPERGVLTGIPPQLIYTPAIGFEGTDSFTYAITDDSSTSNIAEVTVNVKPVNPFLLTGVIPVGTETWTNVALPRSFVSMVAVCTPAYDPAELPPLAVRVQNAYGNSFQVRLYRADNLTEPITDIPVHYVVIEEGRYNIGGHGAMVEAHRYTCPPQDGSKSWTLNAQTYLGSYKKPVVIGQILSTNSPSFQVFWAADQTHKGCPTNTALFTGRHAGEDRDMSRSPEDIGYIVFESGAGTLSGLGFEAGLTPRAVTHNPYRHSIGTIKPDVTLLSTSGIRGSNGCFPVLMDEVPTEGGFRLTLTEDFLGDSERSHAREQVAYVAFQSSQSTQAYAVNQSFHLQRSGNSSASDSLPVTLKALSVGPEDEWLVTKGTANGSLLGTPPQLTYCPKPGFEGTDSFAYRLKSARGDSNTATVNIHVTAQTGNRAPILEAIWAGPDPDNLSTPALLEAISWDPDDDSLTHTWECVNGPGNVTFKESTRNLDPLSQAAVSSTVKMQASFSEAGDYRLKLTTSDAANHPTVSYLSVNVKIPPRATIMAPPVPQEVQRLAFDRLYLLFVLLGPSMVIAYFWVRHMMKQPS